MEYQRATDNIDRTLGEYIAAENDPGKRANLLILQAMAINLSANTMALNALSTEIYDHKIEFKEHRDEFKKHADEEAEILAQMKGGSKVFMYAMSLIQAIVFSAFAWGLSGYSSHTIEFRNLQMSVAAYHAKIDSFIANDTHVRGNSAR